MIGIGYSFAIFYILFLMWRNGDIELKWKIIFTASFAFCRFVLLGLISVISSGVVLIIVFFILRWNGEKIR
jgi:hypothetical protein